MTFWLPFLAGVVRGSGWQRLAGKQTQGRTSSSVFSVPIVTAGRPTKAAVSCVTYDSEHIKMSILID
eukprot:scaffold199370_cov38-Prasinocladus_malaysianus.AAC.1